MNNRPRIRPFEIDPHVPNVKRFTILAFCRSEIKEFILFSVVRDSRCAVRWTVFAVSDGAEIHPA